MRMGQEQLRREQKAATTGCIRDVEKANIPSSHGLVMGYQGGDGKSGVKLHRLWQVPHLWRKRRVQGTGSLGALGRAATGRTRKYLRL